MRFSRACYTSLCQKFLITAAVLTVGVSAVGVHTLDIVAEPRGAAGAPGVALAKAPVDVAPVTPKVREIRVAGISGKAKGATGYGAARRLATGTGTGASKRLVALSDPQPVHGYATVGVTWKHGVGYSSKALTVEVRTENDGTWSGWNVLAHDSDDGPDSSSSEVVSAKARPGTDALVVGDVDQVQMRAETSNGTTPPDLELAVIDPGTGTMTTASPAIDTATLPDPQPADGSASRTQSSDAGEETAALNAMRVAAKPTIYSRAQWGANERLREQTPPSYGTVKTGFIHHTVNANNYSAAQVPALIRGIYAYHTQSRGWRDIGYNFLVDRFGRIWEGRWGGVDKAVVGAHTLGYNEVSFAMSAIGNFDTANPPQAVLTAFAKLFAWKLSLYDIRADGSHVWVKNRWLHAINGHRDVGQTACPGRYLYAKIPSVRSLAQSYQNAAPSAGDSAITSRWRAIGGYRSVLGGPSGSEYSVAGGRARLFQKGRIYAKDDVGAHELYGKVLRAYTRRGAAHSRLGFPRSAPVRFKRGVQALFEKGLLKVFRSGRVKVTYSRR